MYAYVVYILAIAFSFTNQAITVLELSVVNKFFANLNKDNSKSSSHLTPKICFQIIQVKFCILLGCGSVRLAFAKPSCQEKFIFQS